MIPNVALATVAAEWAGCAAFGGRAAASGAAWASAAAGPWAGATDTTYAAAAGDGGSWALPSSWKSSRNGLAGSMLYV